MKIPITIYDELKRDDIIDATIRQQSHGLVIDFPVKWFEGTPYKITVQNIENRKILTTKQRIQVK